MTPAPQKFEIMAQAEGPVEVLIYDDIYSSGCAMWGGICADEVVSALLPYRDRKITVRINSGGGDVWAGFTLYNFLKDLPDVTTIVDGIAASAASVVALAGNPAVMPRSATLMIHNPSAWVIGEASDMRKMAEDLDRTRDQLADIYVEETGATRDQVIEWMDAETWFNGQEALREGFVDQLTNTPAKASAQDLNRHRYKHVPNRLRRKTKQSATAGGIENQQIMQTKIESDIAACACGGKSVAAVVAGDDKAALAKERDELRNQVELLKNQLDLLKKDGVEALKARAVTAVDSAIADKRLHPALREPMIQAYTADEGSTLKHLAELPHFEPPVAPGTEPLRVRSEVGVKSIRDQVEQEPDLRKRMELRRANWSQLIAGN
jgi:ATP-dependent Clp endopeptidase proteolytic subunit ClpP